MFIWYLLCFCEKNNCLLETFLQLGLNYSESLNDNCHLQDNDIMNNPNGTSWVENFIAAKCCVSMKVDL